MKKRGLKTLGFLLVVALIAAGFAAAHVRPERTGKAQTAAATGCQLKSPSM
jgi:hypothetical protein